MTEVLSMINFHYDFQSSFDSIIFLNGNNMNNNKCIFEPKGMYS